MQSAVVPVKLQRRRCSAKTVKVNHAKRKIFVPALCVSWLIYHISAEEAVWPGDVMSLLDRFAGFARKPLSKKLAAINATFLQSGAADRRRLWRALTGPYAPPRVLHRRERMYVAYRPDADAIFGQHPEIAELSEKWVQNNVVNNAGDLPRLYALVLNIKQVFEEGVRGDIAELGVYKGNSAAFLAHFARASGRKLFLFDTFEGFDRRDLVGSDERRDVEFADTSIGEVQRLVGLENVTYVPGRFPSSISSEIRSCTFSVVHIDCDLYEPAKAGLEFFYPRLSPGGLIIMHDYANPYWKGIKQAVDEYCCCIVDRPIIFGDKSGTAMIRKSSNAKGDATH